MADAARRAPEGRALAVRDARVEGERGRLPLLRDARWPAPRRPSRRPGRRDRGRAAFEGSQRSFGSAGPANGSSCERPTSSIASATKRSMPGSVRSLVDVGGDALALDDAQAGRARARLLDELGLALADLGRELGAGAQHALGDEVGARPCRGPCERCGRRARAARRALDRGGRSFAEHSPDRPDRAPSRRSWAPRPCRSSRRSSPRPPPTASARASAPPCPRGSHGRSGRG